MIDSEKSTTEQPPRPQSIEEMQQEMQVLRAILDKGITFNTPKKSFLKWFSKNKERTFKIHKLTLGTLDRLAEVQLQMKLNQARLEANPLQEKNRIVKDNAKPFARVVAISVLNSAWKTKIFGRLLAFYFQERIHPVVQFEIAQAIDLVQDTGNFINSIRLLSGMTRTSQPKPTPIEAAPLG